MQALTWFAEIGGELYAGRSRGIAAFIMAIVVVVAQDYDAYARWKTKSQSRSGKMIRPVSLYGNKQE